MKTAARLAELGVVPASALGADVVGHGTDQRLPVLAGFAGLLPGGLARGSTVAVTARGAGATSLLLALLAGPSQDGAWCAVVGLPLLSLAAAADMGVVLERLAVVPRPGPEAAAVTATLLDGFDLVAVACAGPPRAAVCSHLSARARHSKSVLVPVSPWLGATLTVSAEAGEWFGRRRLRSRKMTVSVSGRGGAARPRRTDVWLPPDPDTAVPPVIGGRSDGRRLQVVR
jgi:hypothetical protein